MAILRLEVLASASRHLPIAQDVDWMVCAAIPEIGPALALVGSEGDLALGANPNGGRPGPALSRNLGRGWRLEGDAIGFDLVLDRPAVADRSIEAGRLGGRGIIAEGSEVAAEFVFRWVE